MNEGFAVCFQRLIIFLLSLFLGGVTFLSEFWPRYVQENLPSCPSSISIVSWTKRKVFDQKLCFFDLRFCRRKVTVLSGNSSGFVGKPHGHSLIISKLRVYINKRNREIFVVTFLSENYNSLIIKAVEKSQLPDKYGGLDFLDKNGGIDSPTKTEVSAIDVSATTKNGRERGSLPLQCLAVMMDAIPYSVTTVSAGSTSPSLLHAVKLMAIMPRKRSMRIEKSFVCFMFF